MVNESSLKVTHAGEGTKDNEYSVNVVIYNILNYGVGQFSYRLTDGDGIEIYSDTVPSLEARETLSASIPMGKLEPGNHTLELSIDTLDEVDEYNETNNVVSIDLSVLDRTPLSLTTNIMPGNITYSEGEWVNISVFAARGEDRIPTWNWTIDGIPFEARDCVVVVPVGPAYQMPEMDESPWTLMDDAPMINDDVSGGTAPPAGRIRPQGDILGALNRGGETRSRLALVRQLMTRADEETQALLEQHLRDIRDEARRKGDAAAERDAGRLLRQLGRSAR